MNSNGTGKAHSMKCEKCWSDAADVAARDGGSRVDHYNALLRERHGNLCQERQRHFHVEDLDEIMTRSEAQYMSEFGVMTDDGQPIAICRLKEWAVYIAFALNAVEDFPGMFT
jgi:hypothetical protein